MSGLVGYASSDEEDDDIQPEKPAKIARIDAPAPTTLATVERTPSPSPTSVHHTDEEQAPPIAQPPSETVPPTTTTAIEDAASPSPAPAPGPLVPPGPSAAPPPPPEATDSTTNTPPPSPYTLERAALRTLTMPTHPSFAIPSSPSPPPKNSEAAATLSTTTKKFTRFQSLKAQGVHFNGRLEGSAALRNPGLLGKLMEFAGIGEEEGYESTLAVGEGGVPTRWPGEWYVESLVKENERRERKGRRERGEVEFVKGKGREDGGSAAGTPKSASGGGSGSEHRKAKLERR